MTPEQKKQATVDFSEIEQLVEMKRGPRPKVNIYDIIIQELSLHEVGMTGDFLNGMEYARELVRAMKGDK